MNDTFQWPVRVYWEDTDGGGVVYHARYVHFFERSRTEWLRKLGVTQSVLSEQQDIVFAIHRMNIEFLRPARLDDELLISTIPVEAGAASMRFTQVISKQQKTQGEGTAGELIARADVYAACLTASQFQPVRIPVNIKNRIEETIN